ncbi:MAG: medium chain dehydrogenase/reductase family protein [Chloroflexota bacterium]
MNYQHVIVPRRGGPDVMRLVESPLPELGSGEVLVKVLAAGVGFADILMREGLYNDMPTFPFTPGYDIIGIVERGSEKFPPGKPVVALTKIGGYAQYIVVPESILAPAVEGIDPAEAVSLVLNYLTAYQMLHRVAHVSKGERILVHGAAGGVGSALLELGQLVGLEMYGTASHSKHALVKAFGATPIDYRTEDFVERIRTLTGDGVDAVFDAVGGRQWNRSYQALRGGGMMLGYGFSVATTNGRRNLFQAGINWLQMLRQSPLAMMEPNTSIAGYNVNTLKTQRPDWYQADLSALVHLLADGKIHPLVAERFPLSEASRAHELLGQNAVQGKIVLICNPA